MKASEKLQNRIEKLYQCANTRQITEHLASITAGYVNNQESFGDTRVSPAVGLSNELVFFFNDLKEILEETRKNEVIAEV